MASLRGADLVARALARAGTRKVFSLSGNQIMVLYDAAFDAKLDIVHTRHEGAAVHMADAWGRLTGEPGIALLTGGPGHANGLGALFNALAAEAPLVLLSGHAPLAQLGRDAFQELRQADAAAPLCKASWTAQSAATVGEDIARAVRIAKSGRPGPVHVSLPIDVIEARVAEQDARMPDAAAFAAPVQVLADKDAAAILAECARAARPVAIAGPMLANGRGRELRAAFTAATGIPVAYTESARGTADPALGALPDLLPAADLVLLLGHKLDFALRYGQPPAFAAGCRFIQIDPEEEALQRGAASAGAGRMLRAVRSDMLPALETLVALARRGFQGAAGWADWSKAVQEAIDWRPADWTKNPGSSRRDAVHPLAAARAAAKAIAARANTIHVADGGEFGQWAMACARSNTRITNGPGGGIGGAVSYAIAARLAFPDAPVFTTLGDGCFGFYLAEFETAARANAPFVAVLGNDARWNAEHQIQLRSWGKARAQGCTMLPTRYDLAVAALGGYGEYVTRAEELDAAIGRAVESGKPACVNVAIEPIAAPALSKNSAPPGGAH